MAHFKSFEAWQVRFPKNERSRVSLTPVLRSQLVHWCSVLAPWDRSEENGGAEELGMLFFHLVLVTWMFSLWNFIELYTYEIYTLSCVYFTRPLKFINYATLLLQVGFLYKNLLSAVFMICAFSFRKSFSLPSPHQSDTIDTQLRGLETPYKSLGLGLHL